MHSLSNASIASKFLDPDCNVRGQTTGEDFRLSPSTTYSGQYRVQDSTASGENPGTAESEERCTGCSSSNRSRLREF